MPRKVKEETPKGGWDTPGNNTAIPPTHYAAGTKTVRGRLEWVWKPVDARYLAECEARKAGVGKLPEPPKIRKRTRPPA